MKFNLEDIRSLMQTLKDLGLTKLQLKKGDDELLLERRAEELPSAPSYSSPHGIPLSPSTTPPMPEAVAAPTEKPSQFVTSPIVGTFYRSPSPDSDPFVEIGAVVDEETVVGIVEAMKVMNEVKARCKGVIKEVLIENGHPVEYGTRLYRIES